MSRTLLTIYFTLQQVFGIRQMVFPRLVISYDIEVVALTESTTQDMPAPHSFSSLLCECFSTQVDMTSTVK